MIPVFDPIIGDEEIEAVVTALKNGEISGSFGDNIRNFEDGFASYCGCKYGVAVTSGTTALQLAVNAADIHEGDEVLVSTSTNIATALAVVHNGAVPVPIDSENETWNLDLDLIEERITNKTKAIIPVHLFGHPVEMQKLIGIARKHNLIVIEDCAESHGATSHGQMTGSFGDMGCFSFYANKILTTGEGGMVITNNQALAERLRLLRNLGFTKPRFKHDVLGFNFRMTGVQAAFGLAQLKRIEWIIDQKRRVAAEYTALLGNLSGITTPTEKPWAKNVYWMYAVTVDPKFGVTRDELMAHLAESGIDTRTFFCPMNQQPCLQKIKSFDSRPCPVADRLWETGLYLPSSPKLSHSEIETVVKNVRAAFRKSI